MEIERYNNLGVLDTTEGVSTFTTYDATRFAEMLRLLMAEDYRTICYMEDSLYVIKYAYTPELSNAYPAFVTYDDAEWIDPNPDPVDEAEDWTCEQLEIVDPGHDADKLWEYPWEYYFCNGTAYFVENMETGEVHYLTEQEREAYQKYAAMDVVYESSGYEN